MGTLQSIIMQTTRSLLVSQEDNYIQMCFEAGFKKYGQQSEYLIEDCSKAKVQVQQKLSHPLILTWTLARL